MQEQELNDNWILFYDQNSPYYAFSNFYVHDKPLIIDGLAYKTVEHYYQSKKFPNDPEYTELIRNASTPGSAKVLGLQKTSFDYDWAKKLMALVKKYNATMRQDWELVKVDVMTKALKEKFTQDPYCKELLLSTGSKYLVENAGPRDCFWGNSVKNLKDPNKIGQLGILLMALRNELKTEKI